MAVPAARVLWDTHSHILPNLDDGPATLEEAVDMLGVCVERGVTGIVATPHSLSVVDAGGPIVVHRGVETLRAAAAKRSLAIEIAPGMEIRLRRDAGDLLASGDYIPINDTRYALIEFDYTQWANYSDDALFGIALAGFTPVLAHVERIVPLQQHPNRVIEYVRRGYFAQITAISLLDGFGGAPKATAEYLLSQAAVHIVASDTHAPSGSREPWPTDAFPRLVTLVGEEAADLLVHVNPDRVVHGQPPLTITPHPRRRRRFWLFG